MVVRTMERPMTRRRYEDMTPRARRRLVTLSLLRSAASVTLLVVVYYKAPLDASLDTASWIEFGVALLAFAVMIAWQVRAIISSDLPRLRAIQAVAVGLPLLLLMFASAYIVIAGNQPDAFTEALSRTDSLYFTVTVFATVGFGDIAPKTELARVVTTIQMLLGVIVVGLIAKIFLNAVQVAVRRRGETSAGAVGPPAVDRAEAPSPTGGEHSGLGSSG
jgi:voltage-gated potassium channel